MNDLAGFLTIHILAVAFYYPAFAALLATVRAIKSVGYARTLAIISLFFALTQLAAAEFNPQSKYFVAQTLEYLLGLGWVILLAPITIPLFLSGIGAGPRFRWIDWLHGLAWVALIALWATGI